MDRDEKLTLSDISHAVLVITKNEARLTVYLRGGTILALKDGDWYYCMYCCFRVLSVLFVVRAVQ